MTVGIVVFSRTGHTLSVAEAICKACRESGREAKIMRVEALDTTPGAQPARLRSAPDPTGFDAVLFGAPVEGFAVSPVMRAYFEQMPALNGKKTGLFVTQYFSKPWMGGNRAVEQMRALCGAKGADVADARIVNWKSRARASQIADAARVFGAF